MTCVQQYQMKKWVFLFIIMIATQNIVTAQKLFSTNYQNQADVLVFVVAHENQADLKVYRVDYPNQAADNNGLWFFTQYSNQADKKIYFTDYANQADLKIFFVKYKNQAGWRNKEKKYIMY